MLNLDEIDLRMFVRIWGLACCILIWSYLELDPDWKKLTGISGMLAFVVPFFLIVCIKPLINRKLPE